MNLPVGTVFKVSLVMPHLHQGADSTFSFAVGLGSIDLSEFLADTVCFAGFNESMTVKWRKSYMFVHIHLQYSPEYCKQH
ncbi:hypothetical protein [Nitrosomonas sp. Nm33]|uniref:hypothetical protein n=1 Tax=Nitrosomonas sp. Nm33 TaxID=133724 RepID=UPI0015A02875|nr:hypothetical protein [Nitrosomonas sp. Nm33]